MLSAIKKICFAFFIALAITACGGQGSNDPQQSKQAELFKVARMNGCIDCHRVDATVVGPSWKAIADRYKDAPKDEARKLLIESTTNGSQGKWATWKGGDGMPPMKNRVAAETIEQLVDYILSLNDKPSS